MFVPPLKKMKLVQPYGVNYGPTADFYTKLGLKAHNGWDLSAPTGMEVYAVMDGEMQFTENGAGYGNDIRIINKETGLEVVYGHLQGRVGARNRIVVAGELIATSNNTGYSTGPHLHFGVRRVYWNGTAGPFIKDGDNGYFGYIDPKPFFPSNIFDLPVDKQYGLTTQTPGVPSELAWYATNVWFFKNLRRLMSPRERNAFRFGFWDLRTVLDPAMLDVWTMMTKPEAIKRGIVKL